MAAKSTPLLAKARLTSPVISQWNRLERRGESFAEGAATSDPETCTS